MDFDYRRSFVDHIDAFDKCWHPTGFTVVGSFSMQDVWVFATSCCFDFFVTNGLYGLIESDYGRMFPQFIEGAQFLKASESARELQLVISENFSGRYPENDNDRCIAIESAKQIEALDSRTERLSDVFDRDNLVAKVYSYCRDYCEKHGLQPFEVSYDLDEEKRDWS
jgi:hypothetical protein